MTEGTSQGLFIVVAIVIFGIFVSLSYTLFGKTLQPQMVQIFSESTEQVNKDLSDNKRVKMVRIPLNLNDLVAYAGYIDEYTLINEDSFSVRRVRDDGAFAVHFGNNRYLIKGKTYNISGYMDINGEPIGSYSFQGKGANNMQTTLDFKIDNKTGYFESTQEWTYDNPWHNSFILHNTILTKDGKSKKGDIITVKNIKLKEVIK